MNKLIIVANITAQEDKVDFIKTELKKLIEPTKAENGCIKYDLHQDNENPAHFMFYECWKNKELLQVHLQSKHFKNFVAITEGSLKDLTINEMTVID